MQRPSTRSVFTIFVSSPWDVLTERACVTAVVEELNRLWGRFLAFQLDLLQDATDTYSSIGADGQDVVNTQIGDEYDLYLGIMGARFGTPTPRAGSGTEEEFSRALERYRHDRSAIQIMFFFRRLSPDDLSVSEQAQRVQAFMARVRDEGVYTQNFLHTEELASLLRRGITLQTQQWLIRNRLLPQQVPEGAHTVAHDVTEATDLRARNLNITLHEIAAAMNDLGEAVPLWNAAYENATTWVELEEAFQTGTEDLNKYSSRLSCLLPTLAGQFQDLLQIGSRVAATFLIPGAFSASDDQAVINKLASFQNSIGSAIDSLSGLSAALRGRPAWSPNFARGLADCIEVVERALAILQNTQQGIAETRADIAYIRENAR